MSNIVLEERVYTPEGPSKVSLRSRKIEKQPEYKADKIELSKNIQKFDKPKVVVQDPFNYNTISLKKKEFGLTQSASDLAANPEYSGVGRTLGVDMAHDWGKYYDKVFSIVEIARKKTGLSGDKLVKWIYKKSNQAPQITNKKIEDLYIYLNI